MLRFGNFYLKSGSYHDLLAVMDIYALLSGPACK